MKLIFIEIELKLKHIIFYFFRKVNFIITIHEIHTLRNPFDYFNWGKKKSELQIELN